ncbi:MAG TPA: chloride channel protein [Rhodocyclaceae bacterium]|nr:chloride channel protein [Rhodocyclaceae bacterium]
MSNSKRDYSVDRRLLLLSGLAVVLGGIGTLAAFVLLNLIRLFTNLFFYQSLSFSEHSPALHTLGPWVIALPLLGGLIVGLMARFGSDKIRGHGIPEAMEAILFGKSKMSPKVAVLKPLSSGIVIGSGGSFGAEGPIIMTGGALGSLLSQYLHLTAAERKTLLVAGACAGMTAIFSTPVAALLLAVELLLFELRPRSLLPVALACATAGFLRTLPFAVGPLFPLQTEAVSGIAFVSCVLAGVLCAGLTIALTLALYKIEDAFQHLSIHWMWWPALGGLIVGIGGYLEPRALGIGYDVIGDLLNNHILIAAALSLLLVKAIIWSIALGSGTSGGVLAPVLMLGAGLGLLLAPVLPGGSPSLWALACMAAVLGSMLGAPLMAIVFVFELTHANEALLPVMLTTAVAYGVTSLTLKRSIMTEKIARRGLHIFREYSVDPLEGQHVSDLMTQAVISIDAQSSIATALAEHFGGKQKHHAYPVVSAGRLLGMLDRSSISVASMTRTCAELLPPMDARHALLPDSTARASAARMAELGVSRLPVVADLRSMQLVGILSLRDLLHPGLTRVQEETVRERLR